MEILRQSLAVLLVFGLLAMAVWAHRRAQAGGISRVPWLARQSKNAVMLERLGRLPLTPQHTLHMLRIQGSELILVTHPQGCAVIRADAASRENRT